MTYSLNTCLLSGVFGQRFGLPSFKSDYEALVEYFNVNVSNNLETRVQPITAITTVKDYRKLCKLFDDFNWFINTSLMYKSKCLIDRRFGEFVRRVESINIKPEYKTKIVTFLVNQHITFLGA